MCFLRHCSSKRAIHCFFFFFFNDTATTEIYTLSLHDALPICSWNETRPGRRTTSPWYRRRQRRRPTPARACPPRPADRSEEHTSELQSQSNLVCRLLLEKKKKQPREPGRDLQNPYAVTTVNPH